MKTFLVILTTILTSVIVTLGQTAVTETRIIPQSTAPVKINSFTARYVASSSRYVDRGIHYELDYENISTKNIVAIEFGWWLLISGMSFWIGQAVSQ